MKSRKPKGARERDGIMETTYRITRFFAPHKRRSSRTIAKGLSLEDAQKHCADPKTRKEGEWFDGYTREEETAQA